MGLEEMMADVDAPSSGAAEHEAPSSWAAEHELMVTSRIKMAEMFHQSDVDHNGKLDKEEFKTMSTLVHNYFQENFATVAWDTIGDAIGQMLQSDDNDNGKL